MIEIVLATVVILLLVVILIGLWMVNQRIGKQVDENRHLDARLSEQIRASELRLHKLESRVDNLPTHRDLIEVRTGMGQVVESVASHGGKLQAISEMLSTIQRHLLESNK